MEAVSISFHGVFLADTAEEAKANAIQYWKGVEIAEMSIAKATSVLKPLNSLSPEGKQFGIAVTCKIPVDRTIREKIIASAIQNGWNEAKDN